VNINCENVYLTVPGGGQVSRETVVWILSAADAAISICFLLMVASLKKKEVEVKNLLNGNVKAVEDYTVEVRNLPLM
jgi:hypothetical protein